MIFDLRRRCPGCSSRSDGGIQFRSDRHDAQFCWRARTLRHPVFGVRLSAWRCTAKLRIGSNGASILTARFERWTVWYQADQRDCRRQRAGRRRGQLSRPQEADRAAVAPRERIESVLGVPVELKQAGETTSRPRLKNRRTNERAGA